MRNVTFSQEVPGLTSLCTGNRAGRFQVLLTENQLRTKGYKRGPQRKMHTVLSVQRMDGYHGRFFFFLTISEVAVRFPDAQCLFCNDG